MSDNGFRIIFKGILPDFSDQTDQVKARFSQLFGLSADKTARLFERSGDITLKSGLDRQSAQRYLNRLSAIGVAAQTDPSLTRSKFPVGENNDNSSDASAVAVEHNFRPQRNPEPAETEPTTDDKARSQTTVTDEPQLMPFVFTGNGAEYFRIWIVNLFLTIVTLGIYSAWAKVRKKKYFYGNTLLDDTSFEYNADPKKILLGRLVSAVFLALYIGADFISATASLLVFLLLMAALPWIVCKSLRFNARYSSYRHLAFRFNGSVINAAKTFLLWPLVGLISFGLMIPYAIYRQQKFMIEGHAYGTAGFEFQATAKDYFKLFFILIGGLLLAIVAMILLSSLGLDILAAPIFLLAYLLLFTGFAVMMANIRYNNSVLASHSFHADWQLASYTRLFLFNTLATVVTLGLFIPWAKVRTARYKAEHTWFLANGDIDSFIATEQEQVGSLGEGVTDLFDIELGF